MISQQLKWFVTNTPGQFCIFYYFSGFLNKKDVFDYICKDKSLNSTSFLLKSFHNEKHVHLHIYPYAEYITFMVICKLL